MSEEKLPVEKNAAYSCETNYTVLTSYIHCSIAVLHINLLLVFGFILTVCITAVACSTQDNSVIPYYRPGGFHFL